MFYLNRNFSGYFCALIGLIFPMPSFSMEDMDTSTEENTPYERMDLGQEKPEIPESEIAQMRAELLEAIEREAIEEVRSLLKNPSAIRILNPLDKEVEIPLHRAAIKGHLEIMQLLLDKGANLFAADQSGNQAIHHAAICGHDEIVIRLIKLGVPANSRGDFDNTPLHYAAEFASTRLVDTLIETFGQDIYTENKGGSLPIHYASYRENIDVVKYFVDTDSKLLEKRNNKGNLPVDMAESFSF